MKKSREEKPHIKSEAVLDQSAVSLYVPSGPEIPAVRKRSARHEVRVGGGVFGGEATDLSPILIRQREINANFSLNLDRLTVHEEGLVLPLLHGGHSRGHEHRMAADRLQLVYASIFADKHS